MTKIDEAFNDLKAGTDHEIMKRRYSSGTLSRAYILYLEWANTRRKEVRDSIKTLEKKEKKLQDSTQSLEKDAKEHERIASITKKRISKLEKKEQEISDLVAGLEKSRDSLETALNDLNGRGVTEVTIARINNIDFRDGDELLRRVATLETFTQLEEDYNNTKAEYARLDILTRERVAWHEDISGRVRSVENELDEVKRRNFLFKESIEIVKSLLKAGYDKKTLLSLNKALRTLEIKGKPKVSMKRLLDGLSNYKELHKLESTLRTKRQELTEVERELEKGKGTLTAFQDTVLKELKGTKKEFTKNIKSINKQYLKLLKEFEKDFKKELKALFEYEKAELEDLSIKAKETLASIGLYYSNYLSGMTQAIRASATLENEKK